MHVSVSDLGRAPHRPMPFAVEGALSPADFDALAEGIEPLRVAARGTVTRTGEGEFLIQGQVETDLRLACARCLEPVSVHLSASFQLPAARQPAAEDVLPVRDQGEGEYIDLGEMVRERLLLEVPMRVLCRDDCRGICPTCGQNLNHDECDHRAEETDPRFDVLARWKAASEDQEPR